MAASVTLAFLHHAAAFVLVAALVVELVLLRGELTPAYARAILRMDAVYGVSALMLLVVGLLRVFYTEKGPAYYFASAPFIVKIVLFAAVGLMSIYPTVQFLRWRPALRENRGPDLDAARRRALRMVIHTELTLVMVIILCAALMARGVGYFG